MRLESSGRVSMTYGGASWHRPYGGEEGLGFGHGEGAITGELDGKVVWANYPRRREDGVWTPNLRGMITAADGHELVLSVHGQSIEEQAPGNRRAILARIELTTEAEPYRWLNTCFLVGEGEIDEERENWWLDTYVCVSDVAQGQPALGSEPPERFRQLGAS